LRECRQSANIPAKVSPIEKRINTELLIVGKRGFTYKNKRWDWIMKRLNQIRRIGSRKCWTSKKRMISEKAGICGSENTAACLEYLTLHGRKAKLTAACLN